MATNNMKDWIMTDHQRDSTIFPSQLFLSARLPRNDRSIKFSEAIEVPEFDNIVDCSYTLSASSPEELPNEIDVEMLKGLVSLTHEVEGFKDATLIVLPSRLLGVLGWDQKYWSTQRLLEAIKRWYRIDMRCEYRMRKGGFRHTDSRFGIVDSLFHIHTSGEPTFKIYWNKVICDGFRGEYGRKYIPKLAQQLLTPLPDDE